MSTTAPTSDYAAARDHMVDGQVRPNKVIDPRIIRGMRQLPRERFLPPALASRAYADEDVPLPGGRALVEPMVIARLVQLLRITGNEAVLVVAAGPGYGAALLAACGARVTALEDDPALLALARTILPAVAPSVTLVQAPVAAGWPDGAPYDAILIEGAVPEIPDAMAALLRPGTGRIATVRTRPGSVGQGVLAEAVHVGTETRLRAQAFFDCATPMLPQFAPAPAFTF